MAWKKSSIGVQQRVNSTANIGNIQISGGVAGLAVGGAEWLGDLLRDLNTVPSNEVRKILTSDPELTKVIYVLYKLKKPTLVTQVADLVEWDSEKTADALERGGKYGVLVFSRGDKGTMVGLAE
jgi:hypothetical protein